MQKKNSGFWVFKQLAKYFHISLKVIKRKKLIKRIIENNIVLKRTKYVKDLINSEMSQISILFLHIYMYFCLFSRYHFDYEESHVML